MDVLLIFHFRQWLLGHFLGTATGQIAVQLIFQESTHLAGAILLLHHHQCRILRQRFAEHGRALHVGADHAMRPPLMSHFMGGDVVDVIDLAGVPQVGDKTDRLRKRNGIGERLRKACVIRKLQDTQLMKLVRCVVSIVVIQRIFRTVDHSVHVPRMRGVVIHRNIHALP